MTGEAVEGGVVKGGGENPSGSPDSIAGIFFTGHGNGYRLTVPAKSTDKILKLYLGLWHGRGRFEAKQSDGSVPSYLAYRDNSAGSVDRVLTLSFNAASDGFWKRNSL